VDAIGLGGLDLFLQWMGRRYYFREARYIAAAAKRTPVVCGAGLKDTLERRAVAMLDRAVGWRGRRVLLTLAVDRFGMAEALVEHGAEVRFGDLMFASGPAVADPLDAGPRPRGADLAPAADEAAVSWLYPDRGQPEQARHDRPLRRALPLGGGRGRRLAHDPALRARRLDGMTILTNTTTKADVAFLAAAGAEAAGDHHAALRGPLARHQPARGRVRGPARPRPGARRLRGDPRRAGLRADRGPAERARLGG
jgi:hypothetical protein